MRILLVEDDADLGVQLTERLGHEGYILDHSEDGEEGLYLAETGRYAAVILDVGLPLLDGLSVLDRLRRQENHVPVLLLTARDGWRDKVSGLRRGADDYLSKPFETEELLARLEALIRRSHGASGSQLQIGEITIDFSARSVARAGCLLHLTPVEYKLLACLATNRGNVVDKASLSEQIWQEEMTRELNAVEVVVARLRKKVGVELIQTKRGHGYVITK